MNDRIIIFGSCYGTTKQYAEELSKRTGIEARSYEDATDINGYKTIIYMGGLYAGGVQGMKKTLKKLAVTSEKKVIIVTVGLADPTDMENIENIRLKMKSQLSKCVLRRRADTGAFASGHSAATTDKPFNQLLSVQS